MDAPETSTEEDVVPVWTDEPDDVIRFKRTHVYAFLLPLAFVAGLSLGYIFWGRGAPAPPPAASQASAQGSGEVTRYPVTADDDYVLGPADAPITIVEFSDYECPFCIKFHGEVLGRLLEVYGGEIQFVYRDFPLTSLHPNAFTAALAANCAGEQGRYYEYHDALFSGRYGLGAGAYEQYAAELGLDIGLFNACYESNKYEGEVQADFDFAAQLGVRSTPTFFINGIAVVGAQPFEVFQQLIEAELAGELE
jgi:protein-disulfide isomerase